MNYSSAIQNTTNIESFVYTPCMIKPSTNNISGYVSYIDLLKFGNVTDFGFLSAHSSFNTWAGFISSVHEHLQNLYIRLNGDIPTPQQNIRVTGIQITDAPNELNTSQTGYIRYNISPINATNKSVTWSSSNTNYLTINNNGQYSCIGGTPEGINVTITVTTTDGNHTDTVTIKCYQVTTDIRVTGVSLAPTSKTINTGESTTLTATVIPRDATNQTLGWSSNNNSVATVNNGVVYGVSTGTAIITVSTMDGNKTATSTITVTEPTSNYYWYIGIENPSSISDIKTDNTVPGWHEIGSSLSGFKLDTDETPVIFSTTLTNIYMYYVVIPNELNIYDADDQSMLYSFNQVECNITGYKAYQYDTPVRRARGVYIH